MKKLLIPFFLPWLVTAAYHSHAQQVFAAGSGSAASGGFTLHSTLGQAFCSSVSNAQGTVFQGIQLPFEYSVLALPGMDASKPDYLIFPNPAGNTLRVELPGYAGDLQISLYDLQGRLLVSGNGGIGGETLSLEGLKASVYLLRISRGNRTPAAFRIIKK